MGLRAPKGAVEQISGDGERFVFPAGNYAAVLEEVRIRDIPTNDAGESFAGFVSVDGAVLGLQFGQLDPLDVIEADVGDRKFFVDITLRDGELTLDDVDLDERGAAAWQLQRSARTLLNFFVATGHAHENGDGTIEVSDEAIAELESGKLNGAAIGIGILNRRESAAKYKQRLADDPKAKRRQYDGVRTFFATP